MGLHLHHSLLMLLFLTWFYYLPVLEAANLNVSTPNTTIAARSQLDAHIQSEACRTFIHPRTGVSYSGTVPPNLTDIHYTGMRLRSGSFRRRGVDEYYEFHIPKGVLVTPYVKRLILVYQNLGNRSGEFYKLPRHKFLTPVLGLLAYDAANLSAKNLPKLNITASLDPISIVFPKLRKGKDVYTAKCVRFDSEGLVYFSKRESKNTCSAMQQGHFAIVAEKESRLPHLILFILVVIGVPLYFCIRWFRKEYKAQQAMWANQRAQRAE